MSALISRRRFGQGLGALTIAFSLIPPALADGAKLPGDLAGTPRLDAWLRIDADGTVTVFTGKVELGQGILTAFEQIVADELYIDPARIRIISGDTAQTPDEGFTAGSQSMEYGGTALRHACAEARQIFVQLAEKRFGTHDPSKGEMVLWHHDGSIQVNDRKVTLWELAGEIDLHREATGTAPLKQPAALRYIGKNRPRRDIPAKVTGGAAYVQDIRLPGMLFGRISRPPSYAAQLADFDEARVKKLPGVVAVVRDGRFLGVVAEREEWAIAARDELARAAKWHEEARFPAESDIYKYLKSLPAEDHVIADKGGGPAPASHVSLTGSFTRPYTAHASIGPSCAVAQLKDGKLTVWTHSQGVFPLQRDLAKALDMDVAKIRCIHGEGSGCYGHNGADDVALDAALLARAAGSRPVKVQWMRDDEFSWEPFGPAMSIDLRASLNEVGAIVDWEHHVWTNTHTTRPQKDGVNLLAAWHLAQPKAPGKPLMIPQPAGGGDRNAIPLYDLPRQKVVHHFIPQMPIRVSALRGLGAYANIFAVETFMDDLAKAAKVDPVEFRLRHLSDPRANAVIQRAAALAGWQPGLPGGTGKGRGVGFAKYKNLSAYLAVIVDVEVDRASGKVRVTQAKAAIDAGQTVNPNGLINQTEGGIIQAVSWTLKEQVTFSTEHITSRDWVRYPILAFPEVPAIEVSVLDRPEERSLGAGEAAQGPAAAAIGNAIHHATGVRLRDLPLSPERIKGAFG
ncbi:MAG TPA: molybdopterin cofactor-binding domain-containing protein [Stellaceae bacterium]|nr:molybdopterin cofactor-binding domain-containing protein [Stellaceae bacterium]